MRLLAAALFVPLLAGPAAAQPDTQAELDALERKLVATLDVVRASAAAVVVSRSDQYPKPAAPPDYPGRLGGFDPAAVRAADPTPAGAELAARLDLSDRRALPDHGAAGGVVIDPAGLVLTNFHVIDGATKIYVHLPGGGSYADIYAADQRSDLAVLKLLTPPAGLKAAPLGDPRPLPAAGKLVVVAGPLGGAGGHPAGVLGSVTAVRRPPEPGDNDPNTSRSVYHYGPVVEFDPRANPGVSGAGVFATDGRLVGLTTTAAAAGVGGDAGQALPLDRPTRKVLDVLRRGEEVEYGFLGVTRGRGFDRGGFTVGTVQPRTPAAAAGLAPQDTITAIDGQPVEGYPDLLLYIGTGLAGNKVRLTVARPGGPQPVEAALAKFRNDAASVAAVRPDPVFGLRVDYRSILAQQLPPESRTADLLPAGVTVREAVPNSPAAARFGTPPGRWLVTHLDGTPTPTPADFRAAAKGKASVRLTAIDADDQQLRPRDITLP